MAYSNLAGSGMIEAGICLPAICINYSKLHVSETFVGIGYQCYLSHYYDCSYHVESDNDNEDCAWVYCKRLHYTGFSTQSCCNVVNTIWGYVSDLRLCDGTAPQDISGILGIVCNYANCGGSTCYTVNTGGTQVCWWCNVFCPRTNGWYVVTYGRWQCHAYPSDLCANKCSGWHCTGGSTTCTSYWLLGAPVIGLGDSRFVIGGVY